MGTSNFYFFSIELMIWNVLKCPFSLASDIEFAKVPFSSFLKISDFFFVDPLLPVDLPFCILFRELHASFSVKSTSQSFA